MEVALLITVADLYLLYIYIYIANKDQPQLSAKQLPFSPYLLPAKVLPQ